MRKFLALLTVAGVVASMAFAAAPSPASASCDTSRWTSYDRPAQYAVVKDQDVHIKMSDGVELNADIYRPQAAAGTKFPVIVTQTPYGKTALGPEQYFVQRGYVQVVVEVRGTGTSGGTWHAFDQREQRDGYEIVDWAYHQSWSDGRIGLYGASYLAINQLFTAAQHPPGVKAIFPIVPEADAFRDIVFVGGQANVAFIPFWMGLVTAVSVAPGSATFTDPATGAQTIANHMMSATDYQASTLSDAIGGGDIAYDGADWRLRSPIEVIDKIDVPTFITGGLHDIFQRGEPLLYEALKRRGITTKLLMGDWGHLNGSTGAGLPVDGVPALTTIALRWFDQYVRGVDTGAACVPEVTQFLLGDGHFHVQPAWPNPDLRPQVQYLQAGGKLSTTAPPADGGSDQLPQNPVNGACSRSTNQWLMGALDGTPCAEDNRVTELGELTFSTEPLAQDVRLTGPLAARIWVATTAKEAVVTVRVTDVDPSGRSTELSDGLLAASHRALDTGRSRVLNGVNLQPFHPYTRAAVQPVTPGEPMPLDIEIFSTNAVLKAGHKLRVAVGPSDFPHAASPLPASEAMAGGLLTIYHDAAHPSSVALPTLQAAGAGTGAGGAAQGAPGTGGGGGSLPATGGGGWALAVGLAALAGALLLAPRRRTR